jgi:hypothetical protein
VGEANVEIVRRLWERMEARDWPADIRVESEGSVHHAACFYEVAGGVVKSGTDVLPPGWLVRAAGVELPVGGSRERNEGVMVWPAS